MQGVLDMYLYSTKLAQYVVSSCVIFHIDHTMTDTHGDVSSPPSQLAAMRNESMVMHLSSATVNLEAEAAAKETGIVLLQKCLKKQLSECKNRSSNRKK